MKKKPLVFIYLFLILLIGGGLAVGGGVGCESGSGPIPPTPTPSPSPSPSPSPIPSEVGDLVMGDRNSDRVFIYYDILNQPEIPSLKFATVVGPQPDVILDNAGSGIDQPRTLDVANNSLFVGNLDNDTVTIYNNFLTLTDNQAPDVTLDNGGSGIDKPSDLQVFNNDLYVASQDSDQVFIFRDVTTLSNGDAADVTLDNGGSGIDRPVGLAVANNILYVCNRDADTVTIYNSADTLADFAPPDVVLDNAGSFIDGPQRCFVINNVLYVAQDDAGPNGAVSAFSPADALTNGQAPDFALSGGDVNNPLSVAECDGRLFLGQSNWPGLIGFNSITDPAFFPDIVIGPPPQDGTPPIEDVEEISCFDNTLWGVEDDGLGAIFGYLNPASMVSQQFPDVILTHPGMSDPISLIVVPRP